MRGSKSPSSVWPIYSIRLRTLIGQGDQIYRARSSLESKAFQVVQKKKKQTLVIKQAFLIIVRASNTNLTSSGRNRMAVVLGELCSLILAHHYAELKAPNHPAQYQYFTCGARNATSKPSTNSQISPAIFIKTFKAIASAESLKSCYSCHKQTLELGNK